MLFVFSVIFDDLNSLNSVQFYCFVNDLEAYEYMACVFLVFVKSDRF